MPLPALLAIPGVPQAIGAGLSGLFGLLGGRSQAKATTTAAQIQARAARQTGMWQERVAAQQLEFQREEAERLQLEFERAQQANWEMERAREMRGYGETGDVAFNQFALARQQRRMGFEETAADRYNLREELLSTGRTGQARHEATQRRLGTLGRLVGTPQPRGGREIAPYIEPAALRQPEWVSLPEPRQTPFEYPDYRLPPART